jgi:hypothetical protein
LPNGNVNWTQSCHARRCSRLCDVCQHTPLLPENKYLKGVAGPAEMGGNQALQDLPPKFCQGAVVTLRGCGKVKVGEVFRVLGYRDLMALVGPELQGLGIPLSERWIIGGTKPDLTGFSPQDPRSSKPLARAFHSGIPFRGFHVSSETACSRYQRPLGLLARDLRGP